MLDILANRKCAFVWNWRDFPGRPARVAALAGRADMTALTVKSHDGGEWFSQGLSFKLIAEQLRAEGVQLVGSWGYHYFRDPAGELARVRESIDYGAADFHVLNIEDPAVELNPDTAQVAAEMFTQLRVSHPDFPVYFCSHAQPAYHPAQPYYQAMKADIAFMPMAYHTAMHRSPESSISVTTNGLQAYGLTEVPWNAAGALYGEPGWPILPGQVTEWGICALAAGATGLTWWDLDVVQDRPDLLDAVRQIPMPACA